MKSICIISQCSLPIPTIKGGAVETLVEYILDENEKKPKYHFTVISVYDARVNSIIKKYKYTDFVYVNAHNGFRDKVLFQIYRILKHLNIYIPFSFAFWDALRVLKKKKEYDYFVFEAGPTTQLPALSKVIPKEKILVHLHWDGMGNKKKDKCFKYLMPVSDYIGNKWMGTSGCSPEKIKPLFNCANIERFTKCLTDFDKCELRKSLGIPSENIVVIFTGRIVQEKGVKELLEAIDQAKTYNITLLIIGSANFGLKTNTPYEQLISMLIAKSSKQIVFTGFIHQIELYKYYNIADIAVIPSLFQDPAPLVSIETQATGTPLIATRVGGIPEYTTADTTILVDNDNKLVGSIAEAIDYLCDNPEVRYKMSIAAEKHVQKYNTQNYFRNFCKIIDEM